MPEEELKLITFVEKVFRRESGLDKRGPAAEQNKFHQRDRTFKRQWPSAISSHVGIS